MLIKTVNKSDDDGQEILFRYRFAVLGLLFSTAMIHNKDEGGILPLQHFLHFN